MTNDILAQAKELIEKYKGKITTFNEGNQDFEWHSKWRYIIVKEDVREGYKIHIGNDDIPKMATDTDRRLMRDSPIMLYLLEQLVDYIHEDLEPYTCNQHETINQLSKENQQLKSENEALKQRLSELGGGE